MAVMLMQLVPSIVQLFMDLLMPHYAVARHHMWPATDGWTGCGGLALHFDPKVCDAVRLSLLFLWRLFFVLVVITFYGFRVRNG